MKNDAKVISPDEYWDRLSDIQYYMDEPVADPAAIALFFLSEEASKKVKVVLSGEGSDELFGGYNIYCEPLEHTSFDKIPDGDPEAAGQIRGVLPAPGDERPRFPDASRKDAGGAVFCQRDEYFHRAGGG